MRGENCEEFIFLCFRRTRPVWQFAPSSAGAPRHGATASEAPADHAYNVQGSKRCLQNRPAGERARCCKKAFAIRSMLFLCSEARGRVIVLDDPKRAACSPITFLSSPIHSPPANRGGLSSIGVPIAEAPPSATKRKAVVFLTLAIAGRPWTISQ